MNNFDSDLPRSYSEEWLAKVRSYLPAFLHQGSDENKDPIGDVKRLLNLNEGDLDRVLAVHQCLDERVLRFGSSLRQGLREPALDTRRPPVVSQSVRGAVDWGATVKHRAQRGGDPTTFIIRSADRVFDTPENRAIVWLLERLRISVVDSQYGSEGEIKDAEESAWFDQIAILGSQIRATRRLTWLTQIPPERPTSITLKRLKASRVAFYKRDVLGALESVLELQRNDEETLTDVLCRRHFRPRKVALLFEVYMALMLADGFAKISPQPRKSRLLFGSGKAPFASFDLANGDEVSLFFQGWPGSLMPSKRKLTAKRHHLAEISSTQQDLFIERRGPKPKRAVLDRAVLELKASNRSAYLIDGLSQLLGYLGEYPEMAESRPAGWLVAPNTGEFTDEPPDPDSLLWMVTAENAAEAAVERFGTAPSSLVPHPPHP